MAVNIFFYLGLTFIFMHEMDAIRCREWRIFPGLSALSDRTGMIIFIFVHIPLFYWLFGSFENLLENQGSLRTGFNIFLLIHLLIHLLYLKHKNNEFKDWISWIIIAGAASFGLLDLLMLL